jgi:hypothetical protein
MDRQSIRMMACRCGGRAQFSPTLRPLLTALMVVLVLGLAPRHALAALPDGDFYIQSDLEDYENFEHIFGVLDVQNGHGAIDGTIYLRQPADPGNPTLKNSQLWKALPGTDEGVHLQNKETGMCLGDIDDDSVRPKLKDCSDPTTLWAVIEMGADIAIRRTLKLPDPSRDLHVCVTKDDFFIPPATILVEGCNLDSGQLYPKGMLFQATQAPIGTTTSAVALPPSPPAVPPVTPTNCQLSGAAVCGLVQFNCDPLSATDKIVIPSGTVGVSVTGVQANIGLVVGKYLNPGNTSVSVCAITPGAYACSKSVPVTFGQTACSGGGGGTTRTCETGMVLCPGGVCKKFGDPSCDREK